MSRAARGPFRLVTPAIGLAWAAFVTGITLPVLEVEQFFFFTERFSILGGIADLYRNGEFLLAVLIALFSVVLPAWKLAVLVRLWCFAPLYGVAEDRRLALLMQLGRWSMLDVQLVAIVVALLKLGTMVDAQIAPGIYCFGAAVLLTMVLGHAVEHQARRAA